MKTILHKMAVFAITVTLLISCFSFTTCTDSALAATKSKRQPKISLNKTSVLLVKGQSTSLKVKKAKGKVVWKSSKPSVVKVKNGKITALKAGKSTITVKANKQTKKCVVTVEAPKLSDSTLELEVDDEDSLTLTGCKHSVTWKSSNPSVVSVTNGNLSAISAGTAVISATVHGATFSCNITVTAIDEDTDDSDVDDSEDDSDDSDDSDDDSSDDSGDDSGDFDDSDE